MSKMRNLIVGAALAALALSPAFAAAETYKIDPAHTQVNFSIRHLVSRVQGRFRAVGGEITLDRENWAASKVTAEIDSTSIDTGNEKRDGHLKSDDFFKTEKNPKISFVSTAVTAPGKDKLSVAGNLTMAGVTKPVTLDVAITGFMPGLAGFEAKTKVNRQDFGINWNRALDQGGVVLGDEVDITITVEAKLPPKDAPKVDDKKPAPPPEKKPAAGN
jgi:polyisoprenoid-binding protein YceI